MDNRLFRIDGERLTRLRREDLPRVARAIIAVLRQRARAGVSRVKNVDYVELRGTDIEVLILRSDWEKILPLVQEGAFDPLVDPVESGVAYSDPKIAYNEPVLDRADRRLYDRIVGSLYGLFPETFPTRPF